MKNIQERIECSQVRWNNKSCQEKFGIHDKDCLCLWIADSDLPLSDEINKYLVERTKHPYYGYNTLDQNFIDSFLKYHKEVRGQDIDLKDVFFTPGTVFSFSNVLQAISQENDGVLMNTPIYAPLYNVSSLLKREINIVRLQNIDERFYFDFQQIEKAFKEKNIKVFVMVSPLNPSGRIWEHDELKQIVELCKKYNVYIISDEIHCDVIFGDKKFVSMLDFFTDYKNIIVLTSVNKTFNIAGVQVGWGIIKDKEIYNKVKETLALTHTMEVPNIFAQALMEGCFKEGNDFFVKSMDLYKKNYLWMKEYLINNIEGIKVMELESTFLPYICFKQTKISNEDMKDLLWHKAKVLVQFNEDFVDDDKYSYFRINVATTFEIIQEACYRIATVINNFKKEKLTNEK
ncbi:MalY/PatB family protein [Spiroplasma culicicola]|uniref:cysteine-S-conjugate beta-lyase n=1 Tax=Spiroplasma culicicola AES-1 TaxID=1276246 RepID=W6A6F1_9MOLU|nr:aminotransferase class I/II-fold pyridoxal phosphate-dependent enzyme [Spiroplasma culicicola]AHI52683.1 cystathione beta-lyase [Spiroplasma culicicola AES-1]